MSGEISVGFAAGIFSLLPKVLQEIWWQPAEDVGPVAHTTDYIRRYYHRLQSKGDKQQYQRHQ